VESLLGVRLFQRSTRKLVLTEAGEGFLAAVSGGLETVRTAIAGVSEAGAQPAGVLRVSMSPGFGLDYLVPLLRDFVERYPAVVPDWHFDNRQVELIVEGFDAAIGGGVELTPGIVARELARAHVVAVASPAYLARAGRPKTPADLQNHDGIVMRSSLSGRIRAWALRSRAGGEATVEMKPRVILSEPEAIARAALMDLGIGFVAVPHALSHLASGALKRVLPDWHADAGPISLYFPALKLMPAKTRVFVDFVVAEFRRRGLAKKFLAGAAE
jgi:DNA-binding transcriptional LysR family regulator